MEPVVDLPQGYGLFHNNGQMRTACHSRCIVAEGIAVQRNQVTPAKALSFSDQTIDQKQPSENALRTFWSRLKKGSWRSRFSGWRGGTLVCIFICTVVLLINVLLIIVAVSSWDLNGGIATAFIGDCTTAARQSVVAHFFINVLSSSLLGVSNYCMQRLVAPTRKEIDDAHARRKWLDIGVPSVRNLFFIAPSRRLLWIMLALSSLPLHFIYNSAIFSTVSANVVTFNSDVSGSALGSKGLDIWNRKLFANMSNNECHEVYNAPLISRYGRGWGVRANKSLQSSLRPSSPGSGSAESTDEPGIGKFGLTMEFDYCISEIIQPHCQIQASVAIMAIVIFVNIVKLIAVVTILLRFNDKTIVTIGDAVQSFVLEPDLTTKGHCLLSQINIRSQWQSGAQTSFQKWRQRYGPPWYTACSLRRWVLAFLLMLVLTTPTTLFVVHTALSKKWGVGQAWNGLGHVSPQHVIPVNMAMGGDMILTTVLAVNAPQFFMSLLYVLYNGLFTCMLAGREWTQYAVQRAPLRVTSPLPGQRSTHFLQLPYRWSLPLLTISAVLHWCISQSVFLARVAFYQDGKPWKGGSSEITFIAQEEMPLVGNVFNGIGYSETALVVSLSCVAGLTSICWILARWKSFPRGLPSCGTNSAIISAACHINLEDETNTSDENIVQKSLQWGVTTRGSQDIVGHLCFSSNEVEQPEYGCLYAGRR